MDIFFYKRISAKNISILMVGVTINSIKTTEWGSNKACKISGSEVMITLIAFRMGGYGFIFMSIIMSK